MDLTLAAVLTAAGATISAGLITGLIALLKNLPGVGTAIDAGREPLLAFILSAILVVVAFAATGPFTVPAGFAAFLAWYGIATISMGVHDHVATLRGSGDDQT